ncbi:hypothetical protein DFH06DRAFT_1122934 [Mycena polygramma]|nr:hypothetical protein DFH06DRAFT_1122934 [Mycena polygramma]
MHLYLSPQPFSLQQRAPSNDPAPQPSYISLGKSQRRSVLLHATLPSPHFKAVSPAPGLMLAVLYTSKPPPAQVHSQLFFFSPTRELRAPTIGGGRSIWSMCTLRARFARLGYRASLAAAPSQMPVRSYTCACTGGLRHITVDVPQVCWNIWYCSQLAAVIVTPALTLQHFGLSSDLPASKKDTVPLIEYTVGLLASFVSQGLHTSQSGTLKLPVGPLPPIWSRCRSYTHCQGVPEGFAVQIGRPKTKTIGGRFGSTEMPCKTAHFGMGLDSTKTESFALHFTCAQTRHKTFRFGSNFGSTKTAVISMKKNEAHDPILDLEFVSTILVLTNSESKYRSEHVILSQDPWSNPLSKQFIFCTMYFVSTELSCRVTAT